MQRAFWEDRSVLVTGCTGFLGAWVSLRLHDAGARVMGLVRDIVPDSNFFRAGLDKEIITVPGSVTEPATVARALNEYGVDTVFHLAAQAIVGVANRSPASTFETNIAGTWVALEAIRKSATVRRVVVASSDKAYGTYAEQALPYKEDYALRGQYPYDVSKACCDLIAQSYGETYFRESQVCLGITRCGNIFGGGDLNFGRIVPDTVLALLHDEVPVIRSHGKHVRDFLYVLDAVEAYLLLAEKLHEKGINGEAFNFALGEPVSVLEMVERIASLCGREQVCPKVLGQLPAPAEILSQYLSAEKARERLGWKPRYTLDDGLRDTIDWYRRWQQARESDTISLLDLDRELIRRFEES